MPINSYSTFIGVVLVAFALHANAQLRTITSDRTQTDFSDLDFLRQELKDVNVVMLGEPSHREGNVFEAKIKLVKFLHEKMGYNVIAFESGFFEVQLAQQRITEGKDPITALQGALFPIWTRSQEFRPLLDYIREHKKDLKIIGFDPQFSANEAVNFLPMLREYIVANARPYAVDDNLVADVLVALQDEGTFPAQIDFARFSQELEKALAQLKLIASKEPKSGKAYFWIQALQSTMSMASDLYHHKLSDKNQETFLASDSNPRDRQMAENLLFWADRFAGEKIICWGATLHFAYQPAALQSNELKTYVPMGRLVRDRLGSASVYTLGTLASGGNFGAWFDQVTSSVPKSVSSSLETQLSEKKLGELLYVPKLELTKMGTQTTSMFDYIPLTGNWSQVVDGILYFNTYERSNPMPADLADLTDLNAVNLDKPQATGSNRRSPTNLRLRRSATFSVSGRVAAIEDDKPIAGVTITSLQTQESAITNELGSFTLYSNVKTTMLRVSAIGFADTTIAVGKDAILEVKLNKKVIRLEEVSIRPDKGRAAEIMKSSIQALKKNLNPKGYGLPFYVDTQVRDRDSVVYRAEYTGSFFSPSGSRDRYLSKVDQLHWIKRSKSKGTAARNAIRYLDGYMHISGGNVVLQHPMFNLSSLSRYNYSMIEENETDYLIGFESRSQSNSVTTGYYLKKFYGKIRVNKSDLAITNTQLNFELDTAILNRFARTQQRRDNPAGTLFENILEHDVVEVLTDYSKAEDGFYYPIQTLVSRSQSGKNIRTGDAMELFAKATVSFFALLPTISEVGHNKVLDFSGVKYNNLFWEKYQRPSTPQQTW